MKKCSLITFLVFVIIASCTSAVDYKYYRIDTDKKVSLTNSQGELNPLGSELVSASYDSKDMLKVIKFTASGAMHDSFKLGNVSRSDELVFASNTSSPSSIGAYYGTYANDYRFYALLDETGCYDVNKKIIDCPQMQFRNASITITVKDVDLRMHKWTLVLGKDELKDYFEILVKASGINPHWLAETKLGKGGVAVLGDFKVGGIDSSARTKDLITGDGILINRPLVNLNKEQLLINPPKDLVVKAKVKKEVVEEKPIKDIRTFPQIKDKISPLKNMNLNETRDKPIKKNKTMRGWWVYFLIVILILFFIVLYYKIKY